MADNPETPGPVFRPPEREDKQDWARLASHLAEHDFALSLEPAPRQFVGGMGNLNFLLEMDGKTVVLRRPPAGPIPPGANDMRREHRILSRLWQAFPLAPRSYHFCDDESVLGAPFFIMEFREGRCIYEGLPDDLAGQGGPITEMLIGTLAELHAVDTDAIGLGDFGRPEGFLERAVEGWAKRCSLSMDDNPPPVADEIANWLRAHLPPEQPPSLLHNDFKLNNFLIEAGSFAPVALLDWDQGTRGDPLFDFGTLLSYWIAPGDPEAMHFMGQMPTGSDPSFPDRRAVVELYGRLSGRDMSDVLFHRVIGMFKLAVIFLQLYARHRRGERLDGRLAELEGIGEDILDFTWDIAMERAF
jgi:aminoglycoside phosphotransferase (APT) family kinase protein